MTVLLLQTRVSMSLDGFQYVFWPTVSPGLDVFRVPVSKNSSVGYVSGLGVRTRPTLGGEYHSVTETVVCGSEWSFPLTFRGRLGRVPRVGRNGSRHGNESPFSPVHIATVVRVPTRPRTVSVERDPGSFFSFLPGATR